MIETQIYLTEKESDSLQRLANQMGKTPNGLIQEAVAKLLSQFDEETLRKNRMAAAGIWRNRSFGRAFSSWLGLKNESIIGQFTQNASTSVDGFS